MAELVEVIAEVEAQLERRLLGDEIAFVGRMLENGEPEAKIVAVLGDEERTPPPSDDELEVYRYEASGQGIVEIPDVVPEDE